MTTREATTLFRKHRRSNLKQITNQSYDYLLHRFEVLFADRLVESIGADEIYQFLEALTEHSAKSTRRLRYAQIKAFYNLIIDNYNLSIKNPCSTPILSKSFKMLKQRVRQILDKETVDELIYNTSCLRDRLILELQARCGLRIGEVLKLRVKDISDRKLILYEAKSGKDNEVAFMPEQVAKRLDEYIRGKSPSPVDRIFPICYSTARSLIRRYGEKLDVKISPHDLRRHSATYASRNGVLLEIISKIILRHQDLKTTQMYLGKVSDTEAIRWMDVLHER